MPRTMSGESAALPRPKPARLPWTGAARLTLPLVTLAALAAELLLAERKYGLFGGGFGQSQALDTPLEIFAFLGALSLCQALVFTLLYRLVRRLHGKKGDSPLFHLNFAFFIGGGALAVLAAKYEALAYFSDTMSLQIVRNLGGGSLVDALLYSLSEAGLMLIVGGGAILAYLIALLVLRKRWRQAPPLADHWRPGGKALALWLAATPFLLFAAYRVDDARAALSRFDSVILVDTILEQATDFDRDGYSFFSFPVDRQPFDAARHPYALDVPGDGVDEDGFDGDFVFAGPAPAPAGPPPAIGGARPNIVLIVLESTRADSLGRRVDGRAVMPNLEAMAAAGTQAARAYSHVGFTTFSLQSLFTGTLAPADGHQSLFRDFAANGYETGVFSGQAEDFGGTAELVGMRRGAIFVDGTTLVNERSSEFAALGSVNVDGKILLREFDRRLGDPAAWQRPHFLYFNLQSAHFPYHHPGMDRILPGAPIPRGAISEANRAWTAHTYWNAVAYDDALIGAIVARLRRLGILDNTILFVTADHGESLFDDGFLGHGHMLNEQQMRIPFVASRPGIAMPAILGLDDMRAILLNAAGAHVPPPAGRPIFQYLGTLDRPGAIGLVDAAGNRTTFNFFQETVWTSASGRWTRYADLAPAGAERRAADAVIQEWARQRWLRHLAGGAQD